MGITGEMVRSVFSKTRSGRTHESTVRSNLIDKRRWSSVRSYLCGDEFSSVIAAEDSASVKSSEATVQQPVTQDSSSEEHDKSEDSIENVLKEKPNSTSSLFRQEDAALIIQSAFRDFLARRQKEETKSSDGEKEPTVGTESPNRESVGTSIEVQTGNSVEVFSLQEESLAVHHQSPQKARSQLLKLKRDWDDSTVSSNISQMRIQSRLEAATRRERALAYAFSQQLRICSKRKNTRSDGAETNIGWSWLERWMATRIPESSFIENQASGQLNPFDSNQRIVIGDRLFDASLEEKESCGSNEVSVQLDGFQLSATKENDSFKSAKSRLKATRRVSRRNTSPSYQCQDKCAKVSKKDGSTENEQELQDNKASRESQSKKRTKCKDSTSV
ncbi:IQ-domain 33 putative isoform 1 [Tripterygium wilfordii]|uniref:IQ-domain 33 putative isoform 1 n=1 Tax=Tripterygium wilfordii TaxID=458696 RepID=A0A7J7DIF7_TRIWF|nr:protein IQ-DOMAIN 1 [Tripterygium wilfordii]KAF5746131.1 IQ-domain 33 putative isoform 1 [Tripterygium wilfordii]